MAQVVTLASLNLPTTSAYFRFVNDSPLFKTEKPYEILVGNLPPEQESMRQNITFSGHPGVPIRDLRPVFCDLSLARHGIEFSKFPSMLHLNVKGEGGLKEYLGRTRELLMEMLGAEEVIIFDYNIRNSAVARVTGTGDASDGFHKAPDPPAVEVHTDATKNSGLRRIHRHLTKQEADRYMDGSWRLRIVNTWRPCASIVKHAPLAFCDPKSVHPDDLLATDLPSATYIGEIYYLKYNEA